MAYLPPIKKNATYDLPHFPTKMQAVIFRCWESVPAERIAKVLETNVETVTRLAFDMGLKPQKDVSDWIEKGYISILRNVWQILPYQQIMQLLDWDEERLSYVLKEDDFLNVKFGWFKFDCEKVVYKPLTACQIRETERIRNIIEQYEKATNEEKPFSFFNDRYPKISSKQQYDVYITNEWTIQNLSGIEMECITDFKDEILDKYGITLTGSNTPKKIQILMDIQTLDEEYHEIEITKERITVRAGTEMGILRALYFLLGMAKDHGVLGFNVQTYKRKTMVKTRFIYSFCGLYSDVLDKPCEISFPSTLLKQYAMYGINGVWIQAVLYKISPFPFDSEISKGWEKRLENLKKLTQYCKRYGIKVFLYINEPRGMPHDFFKKHPQIMGRTYFDGLSCLCTSKKEVRDYLERNLEYVCKAVPELGGFFNISMSENLTHCYSRKITPTDKICPICKTKPAYHVTADLISLMANAVHRANPNMKFIALTWAWERMFTQNEIHQLISELPKHVIVMNVSENQLEFEKGGIKGSVIDYTLSMPGPSQWSKKVWDMAKQRGLEIGAKLQINNSWECSTVPYMPVFETVFTHMQNLRRQNVTHMMLSWTLGGYPSENIKIASALFFEDAEQGPNTYEETLETAFGRYVSKVKEAVSHFSKGFLEFPFSCDTIYYGPQNIGSANLLYKYHTGLQATMTCYCYDDLKSWCGNFPPEVLRAQFKKVTDEWEIGLRIIEDMPICEFSDMAKYAYTFLKSTYNQITYCMFRDTAHDLSDIIKDEIRLAKIAFDIMSRNSSVGYEAANHYYVTKQQLLEKIISCYKLYASN